MAPKELVMLALQVSIVATVFGFGLKTTRNDFLYLWQRPSLLGRSMFSVFVLMPAVAILMTSLFDIRPAAEIAILALAISPVPPLLPQREVKLGGNHSYGLALMAVLATLAIVTVPLSASVLEHVFGRPVSASPTAIARAVMIATVFPLLAGMLVRAWRPAAADRMEPVVMLGARILLALGALVLLAGTWRALLDAIGGGAMVAMIFVLIGLVVGHVLGGPDTENAVVLALSTASRHPAIAMSIAAASAPSDHFIGVILLFLLVNGVVGTAYLKLRWSSPAPTAVSRWLGHKIFGRP